MSLADLCGEQNADRLLFELHEAATIETRFRIVEQWLLRLAHRPLEHHPAVTFAVRHLLWGPITSSAGVADKVGYSQRHFIDVFRNETGMSPKRFQRLQRFRRVIQTVQRQATVDWVDVALSANYFDQSHLIHDFREFSGITPARYLELRTPHINHVRVAD
jgi:AraC-like DNA-binding protein